MVDDPNDTTKEMKSNFVYAAFVCCVQVCNFDEILALCRGNSDCLCVAVECCLNQVDKPKRVGCITDPNFLVLCGLPCCEYGLHTPKFELRQESKCLCLEIHAQFPFGEAVPGPHCAYCFLSCLPKFGCLQPGPVYKNPEEKAKAKEQSASGLPPSNNA